MAAAPLSLTGTWQSLGVGPFDLQVLVGTALVQSADQRPSTGDATGLILAAAVGVDPTHCGGPGEWWAKAMVTVGTSVLVLPPATVSTSSGPRSADSDAGVKSINGYSTPDVTLTAHDVGTLTAAEIKALVAAEKTVSFENAFGKPAIET